MLRWSYRRRNRSLLPEPSRPHPRMGQTSARWKSYWGVCLRLCRRGLRSYPMFRCQSYISMRGKRRLARRTGFGTRGIFAGLIELQNAPGCLDVEAAKLAFQISQLLGGDPVILGAKKKQCHCRRPREIEGFGQNQYHFPVLVQQGAFDHVARQGAQQGQSDRDLVELMRPRIVKNAVLIQVAVLMLRRHQPFSDKIT